MDPVSALATTVIGLLTPHLAKTGEAIAKSIGQDLSAALRARFKSKPAAQEALDDLEEAPNDADAQAAARLQLKKLLTEDPVFAAQLEKMVQEAEKRGAAHSVSAGPRGVAAGRDIRGNVITGDVEGSVKIDQPE